LNRDREIGTIKSLIAFWILAREETNKRRCVITSSILSLLSANAPSALNYLLAANSTCGVHSIEFRHVTSILMNRNHWSNTTGTNPCKCHLMN